MSNSEKIPITGRPSVCEPSDKVIKEKNVGLRICICATICVIIIVCICFSLKFWYDSIMEERDKIDNKKVIISYPVMDYSIDPPQINNCSHSEMCIYDCKYVRNNLQEDKKSCEYKDYLWLFDIIIIILLILGCLRCMCENN